MENMKKAIIMMIMSAGILSSCSKNNSTGNLYVPTSSDATATATLAELQQGRTLYINNCGACHGLVSPDNYTAADWKTIVPSMASRTSLSAAQVTLVTKYVTRGN